MLITVPSKTSGGLTQTLECGTLLRRYKRFLADVELPTGEIIVAHCPNPGSMIGCAEPGSPIWLRKSLDPKRKLAHTWVITEAGGNFVSVDTLLANKLVKQAITNGIIPEFTAYSRAISEFSLGDSRFDFCLEPDAQDATTKPSLKNCIVEVKSTTLVDGEVAMFPDAKTERGRKHLKGLARAVALGYRAVQFYCISRHDAILFRPAEHIDEKYAKELRLAAAAGVEIMAWSTKIIRDEKQFSVELSCPITVEL